MGNFRVKLGLCILVLLWAPLTAAQSLRGLPSLPTGGKGLRGSVGIGFTDIKTISPSADVKFERGTFLFTQLERPFDFMHLYLTVGLGYMDASGVANYSYTNLSSSTTYTSRDLAFRARSYELALGLKLKLIDDYWFRPYVAGGGLGNYNEVSYGGGIAALSSVGTNYKSKDTIMGSGYSLEAGIEIDFSERFGLKLSARQSTVQTKPLETLGERTMKLRPEVYFLSLLFGL